MNNNLKEIPVFFTVDDGYIPFLAISLKSLIDNTSLKNKYEVKILYTNITEENKEKIKKMEQSNISIEFVDLNEKIKDIQEKLYTRNYYSNATYYRLFLPELYPQYDKAIYIDSDTIVLGDIAELYDVDIEKNLVGAVPDGAVQSVKVFQEYVEKVVGIIDYNYYFNAGILVLNLDELRKYKFEEKFIYLLNKVKYEVAQDQDYLNRLCKGRVKILPDIWNKMPITAGNNEYTKPKIIHFNLGFKPWHFDDVPYQEYFWEYAKKTEFYEYVKSLKDNYTDEE